MKIRITGDGRDFSLHVPNAMLFNGIAARIVCAAVGKKAPDVGQNLTPEALRAVFAELNRIREKHGSWLLVEVESSGGESVEVTL